MPPFYVHTCRSDVKVSLEESGPITIGKTTLMRARLFHHYVFKELHKMDHQTTMLSENDGYLAVPLLSNKTRSFNRQPPCTTSRITLTTPPSPQTTMSCNKGFEIHDKFLEEFSSFFESISDPNMILKPTSPFEDFGRFQNKIVRRLNESANQTHYTRYFVVKVCHDLSPSSLFPDEVAASFGEYYKLRYGIQVGLEQPLLLVQHLPTQVNFIVPRLRLSEDTEVIPKVPKTEIHLIPELCSILPLSASSWSLARFFPTIVCRLEALLRAHEMKMKILSGTGIRCNARSLNEAANWDDGKLLSCGNAGEESSMVGDGNCDGYDMDRVDDDGECNGDDSFGPSVSSVLHALTAKSAGQQYHSERLEILGDSCLKLEVSLDLFLTDPEKDEWTLSVYRKQLVSNDMLSTQGRRLGIPGYISITAPDLTNTSLPPGFNLGPSNETKRFKKESLNSYNHQVLGDKHVADCVEALIAATLVGCGRNAARQFMVWLGVTRCTFSELKSFYQLLPVQTAERDQVHSYIRDSSLRSRNSQEKMDCDAKPGNLAKQEGVPLTSAGLGKTKGGHGISLRNSDTHLKRDTPTRPIPNFDHIEKELGYCFKNKLLLLQSLIHNSYPRFLSLVSETYQRMEFLGDAILDYLITAYLYERFPHLTHGDVTDFRSALVNNFTLAFLAVQKNLHQSLRYMSPTLLDMIGQFVEFLEKQKLKQGASWKVRFYVSKNCSDLFITPDCSGGRIFSDTAINF